MSYWQRNGLGIIIGGSAILIMGLAVGACTHAFVNTPGLHKAAPDTHERHLRYSPSRSRAGRIP